MPLFASSVAVVSSRADLETRAVLAPFISVLQSTDPIVIPPETLAGALTHFLSNLLGTDLSSFVQNVISSPSLWSSTKTHDIGQSIRRAVSTKLFSLRPKGPAGQSYGFLARRKVTADGQAWLSCITAATLESDRKERSVHVLAGLLQGLDDVPEFDGGKPRSIIEEEIVVLLADGLDNGSDGNGLILAFCEAVEHIGTPRVQVLDLKAIVPRIHVALFESLGFSADTSSSFPLKTPSQFNIEESTRLALGLARSFVVLSTGGPGDRLYALDAIFAFTHRMRDVAPVLCRGQSSTERNSCKTALIASIAIFLPALEMILHYQHQEHSLSLHNDRSVNLAIQIILTLAEFSSLTDPVHTESGLETYHKVLYGALDIVASKGGTLVAGALMKDLAGVEGDKPLAEHRATFTLMVAEQMIHVLDPKTVRDIVVPLADKHAVRPQHSGSFEAAHAFLLALVDAASTAAQNDLSQCSFADALVSSYANIILKESRAGTVTIDQLRAAYPTIASAASRRGHDCVRLCIRLLESSTFPSSAYERAVHLIRVTLIPYVPAPDVPDYLAEIAELIIATTPSGSEARLELAAAAFKAVMEDMGDEVKNIGIDWWLNWRDQFQERIDIPRARL